MITIEEAASILSDKHNHWSHEVDYAKEIAERALIKLVSLNSVEANKVKEILNENGTREKL